MNARTMPVNWRAVAMGALGGLMVIVPLAILQAIVTDDGDDPAGVWLWITVIALLFAFLFAGFVAARNSPDLPYSHGALGGLGAVVLWILLRLLRDVVTGHSPKFNGVFLSGLLAVALGIVGGALASSQLRDRGGT